MGKGTWNPGESKTLAGAYMRFVSAAQDRVASGPRGTVAIPVKANWGPVEEVVEIREGELEGIYHTDQTSEFTAYPSIKLALLGKPNKVLGYRLTDGNEAKASVTLADDTAADALTLTTKYPTTRDFNVTVRDSLTVETNQEIVLYEGTEELITFPFPDIDTAVEAINQSTRNEWITATKQADGTLATVSNESLTGGDAGTSGVTNEQYVAAMEKFEAYEFDAFAFDGITDADLQETSKTWVKRLREQGKNIIAVYGGSKTDDLTPSIAFNRSRSFDDEGVHNVGVQGEYEGVWYSSGEVAAYVAGLISGTPLKESITFKETPFSDVKPRLTREQKEEAVESGTIVLSYETRAVRVEYGVNTLNTLADHQDESWKKIKLMRIKDAIDTDTSNRAIERYIGKVPNTGDGQAHVLSGLKNYFETLVPDLIMDDYTVEPDEELMATAEKDEFFWQYSATEIDSMEKIYGTGYNK